MIREKPPVGGGGLNSILRRVAATREASRREAHKKLLSADVKRERNDMLDFIASAFRGVFEFLLWVNVIAFTIGGGIVGKVVFGGYHSDGHPILGGIIGFLIGMILNILGAGLVAIFLRIDENIKILVKLNGGKPVEEGVEAANNINVNSSASPKELSQIITARTVVKETNFNDSLSLKSKTYRTLKIGEKIKIENIIDRSEDLGGIWALVITEKDESGWCLLDALSEGQI
jgi:hypothetical protein